MRTLWLRPFRDIRQMKIRMSIISLMVAAGVGIYAGGFMSLQTLLHTRDTLCQDLNLADLRVNITPADPSELPPLDDIAGIDRYEKRLIIPGGIELKDGSPLVSLIFYMDPTRHPGVNDIRILEGSYFDPEDPHGVIIERFLADIHGYRVGDTITLNPYTFPVDVTVVGIGLTPECLIPTIDPMAFLPMKGSLGIIFAPFGLIEEFFGYPLSNDFSFIYEEGVTEETVKQDILAALTPLGLENITPKKDEFAYKYLNETIKQYGVFFPSALMVFGVIVFLVTLITANRLIISQRKEIGALRALGYRRGEVVFSYLLIAVILSLFGVLIGVPFSYLVNLLFASQFANAVGLPYIIPKVVVRYIGEGGVMMGAVVVAAFFTSLFLLMRLTPQQIIREDRGEAFVGLPRIVSGIGRILGPVFRPGMPLRFGLRNLFRRFGLTSATAASVALAVGLAACFSLVLDSFEVLSEELMSRGRWDAIALLRNPLPYDEAEEIRRTDGIDDVSFGVRGFGQLVIDGEGQYFRLIGHPSKGLKMLEMNLVHGRWFQSENEKGIILNKNWFYEERLTLELGQTVEVRAGERKEHLKIVGLLNEPGMGTAFISFQTAQEILGMEGKVNDMVASINRPVEEVKRNLYRHEGMGHIMTRADFEEASDQYTAIIHSIIYVAQGLSIGIAIFFLFGSVMLNILERDTEYATLRAIGYGRQLISKIVLTELMSEGGAGVLISFPIAISLAFFLNHQMSKVFMDIPNVVTWADLIIIGLLTLLIIPLAILPGLRYIFQLNIPEMIRKKVMG